jgi:Acetyltransferase (GNAT) domain
MNVSLRPLEDRDLDTIYRQVTDPESVRMAAFTAEDQTDRRAFLTRMSRLRADTSVSYRVIDVDGAIAGTIASFRIDNRPEVTYWVDRTLWGKGVGAQRYRFFLPRLPNVRCTPERPRTTSVRFEYWRKLGSDALASTATSHPVAVRRLRKRSCASTEVGTELCVSS